MIGLPVEEKEEEEDDDDEEEEEEDINIEANIPSEAEIEPIEIDEKPMHEQEPTIASYLPALRDEQAKELEILRNENTYLRAYVIEVERKIEKIKDEKAYKAKLKKKRRERREKRK